jgi:purine-nucleoside phosphorylase
MLIDKLKESAAYVRDKVGREPIFLAMVLGSGLGDLADEFEDKIIIPYDDIPHFPQATVSGHAGVLVCGNLCGKRVLAMKGRFHYYEGHSMATVVFPIQMMKVLGIDNLLVTNAAGCVNKNWPVGSLMLIKDHIKLIADSPLRGANLEALGSRFFDMSEAYSKKLRQMAKEEAAKLNIDLKEGVYQLFTGPSYETPAEVNFARLCGSDAVGMSTVPEVLAANHANMEVLGISCLTNMAAGILDQPLNHDEVLKTSLKVKETFTALVKAVLKRW